MLRFYDNKNFRFSLFFSYSLTKNQSKVRQNQWVTNISLYEYLNTYNPTEWYQILVSSFERLVWCFFLLSLFCVFLLPWITTKVQHKSYPKYFRETFFLYPKIESITKMSSAVFSPLLTIFWRKVLCKISRKSFFTSQCQADYV